MRRRVAIVDTFEQAEQYAEELTASGSYVEVCYFRADDGLYEVWVEDKEE